MWRVRDEKKLGCMFTATSQRVSTHRLQRERVRASLLVRPEVRTDRRNG
jgi:hypothetical protein